MTTKLSPNSTISNSCLQTPHLCTLWTITDQCTPSNLSKPNNQVSWIVKWESSTLINNNLRVSKNPKKSNTLVTFQAKVQSIQINQIFKITRSACPWKLSWNSNTTKTTYNSKRVRCWVTILWTSTTTTLWVSTRTYTCRISRTWRAAITMWVTWSSTSTRKCTSSQEPTSRRMLCTWVSFQAALVSKCIQASCCPIFTSSTRFPVGRARSQIGTITTSKTCPLRIKADETFPQSALIKTWNTL